MLLHTERALEEPTTTLETLSTTLLHTETVLQELPASLDTLSPEDCRLETENDGTMLAEMLEPVVKDCPTDEPSDTELAVPDPDVAEDATPEDTCTEHAPQAPLSLSEES